MTSLRDLSGRARGRCNWWCTSAAGSAFSRRALLGRGNRRGATAHRPQSALAGPWQERVDRWNRGPIHKHARRARGVAWDRVQTLDGVTADHDGAQVRALGTVDPGRASTARAPAAADRIGAAGARAVGE